MPNERELSNLLTLSISLKSPICWLTASTFAKENKNHVSFKYVKKTKTDYDFFPDCKKIFLADKLLDFVSSDKVSLEELGTTKKLCITFLLRSGLLFCSILSDMTKVHFWKAGTQFKTLLMNISINLYAIETKLICKNIVHTGVINLDGEKVWGFSSQLFLLIDLGFVLFYSTMFDVFCVKISLVWFKHFVHIINLKKAFSHIAQLSLCLSKLFFFDLLLYSRCHLYLEIRGSSYRNYHLSQWNEIVCV